MKTRILIAFIAMTAQIGCAVPVGEDSNSVGRSSAALGETGCGSLGGTPYSGSSTNGVAAATPTWLNTTDTVTSSGYGTDASCPSQFIAEYSGLDTSGTYKAYLTQYAFFASATECPKLTATIGIYYWYIGDSGIGEFRFHHGKTLVGVYPGSGSTCNFKDASDGSAWTWESIPSYATSKLRVTTKLTYTSGGTTTMKSHRTKLYRSS